MGRVRPPPPDLPASEFQIYKCWGEKSAMKFVHVEASYLIVFMRFRSGLRLSWDGWLGCVEDGGEILVNLFFHLFIYIFYQRSRHHGFHTRRPHPSSTPVYCLHIYVFISHTVYQVPFIPVTSCSHQWFTPCVVFTAVVYMYSTVQFQYTSHPHTCLLHTFVDLFYFFKPCFTLRHYVLYTRTH